MIDINITNILQDINLTNHAPVDLFIDRLSIDGNVAQELESPIPLVPDTVLDLHDKLTDSAGRHTHVLKVCHNDLHDGLQEASPCPRSVDKTDTRIKLVVDS